MTTHSIGFNSQGLINVQYPNNLRKSVEDAVLSWKKFCSLPKKVKTDFQYYGEGNVNGAGYEIKEENGSRKDLKENFHVTLEQFDRLQNIAHHIPEKEALQFILSAHDLFNKVEPLVLEFADNLAEVYQLPRLREETANSRPQWILRYLHYFHDRNPGEEIAAAHADKCGFTLHLYESDFGLQYLDITTRLWQEMPVSQGETVIIPGLQLQLKTHNNLKALYHRVVATKQTSLTGRYSMVCFIPLMQTPLYNKSSIGSVQNFEPGFNYDISLSEFAKFFSN